MAQLNESQRKLVEDHLNIVEYLVWHKIRISEQIQGMGYEDLYQTGCEALCHAAKCYQPNKNASFATFATKVISNRLIDHCRKINRVQQPLVYSDAVLPVSDKNRYTDLILTTEEPSFSESELNYFFEHVRKQYTGIARMGIDVLQMKCQGLSSSEIARQYHVTPNNISAWISRAKKKLWADKHFAYLQ